MAPPPCAADGVGGAASFGGQLLTTIVVVTAAALAGSSFSGEVAWAVALLIIGGAGVGFAHWGHLARGQVGTDGVFARLDAPPMTSPEQRAMPRVALVTGANRGIGLAVATALATDGNHCVILTGRDPVAGQAAVAGIVDKGGVAVYAPLDVLDDDQPGAPDHAVNVRSMTRTAAFVKATFGRLDVLVNNAGVCFDARTGPPGAAARMAHTHVGTVSPGRGMLGMARAFDALLVAAPAGQIINVCSRRGGLAMLDTATELQSKVMAATADRDLLGRLVTDFMSAAHAAESGWPLGNLYGGTKLLKYAATRLLAAEHKTRGTGVVVSAVCPGFVKTRMTGPMASLSPAEGASVIVQLAQAPPTETGRFWTEKGAVDDGRWPPC